MHKRKNHSAFIVLTLLIGCAVAGCSGTMAAYKGAETLEQKAYVFSNHYVALQIEANDIADAGAPQAVIDRMAAAELAARPVILQLGVAAQAYKQVQNADTEESLQRALDNAALVLSDFIDAVRRR